MYVEHDTIETCKKYNIVVQAYSPLAKCKPELLESDVIKKISFMKYEEPTKIVLAYLLAKGYCVIPKTVNEDRLISNIELEGIELSEEDIAEIDELHKTHPPMKLNWKSDDVV